MKKKQPPAWVERLFAHFIDEKLLEGIIGDLEQKYYNHLRKEKSWPQLRYCLEAVGFLRFARLKSKHSKLNSNTIMITSHLKIAYRSLLKRKAFAAVNILGLALGISCSLAIVLFVEKQLSYDDFHKDADRIYRVVKDFVNDDGSRLPDATTPPAVAAVLPAEIPDVIASTRLFPGWGREFLVAYEDKIFYEKNVIRADSSVFDVFTFEFISGTEKTAFQKINSIVLTSSSARKYFGEEPALGKILMVDGKKSFEVTGVIKDLPDNSHFHFDFMSSLAPFRQYNIDSDWGWYNFYTYIKVAENANRDELDSKIQQIYKNNREEGQNIFYTQSLADIHLDSNLKWELEANGDRSQVYIFIILAVFIIVIASINYINLATAKASVRAKEIGVRKALGAVRSQLFSQFITESLMIAFFAFIASLALLILFIPSLEALGGLTVNLLESDTMIVLGLAGLFTLLIGFLAGVYPAFYLSGFKSVDALKSDRFSGANNWSFRKVLVVFQFAISVAMLSGLLVVTNQVDFMLNSDLGLDKDQVIVIPNTGGLPEKVIFNEMKEIPGVVDISGADGVVGGLNWTTGIRARGSETSQLVNYLAVSFDFIELHGFDLESGRTFSKEYGADTLDAIVLNEQAVKELGIEAPVVGKQIVWSEAEDTIIYRKIIGVVKDFHFTSMRNEIKPFAFIIGSGLHNYMVKVSGDNISETLLSMEEKWHQTAENRPFDYYFLDQTFAQHYAGELRFRKVVIYISVLATVIACLGLFGLSAYMITRRTKEIGIRRVLGSEVSKLVYLMVMDFLSPVLISLLLGLPLAWLVMEYWLNSFSYRIDLTTTPFIGAGVAALVMAFLTVAFQSVKAATVNPVKSLKHE